jgi:hypothetical protein
MSRIALAFSCFFRLLFGRSLSADAARYLPPGAAPVPPAALPPATASVVTPPTHERTADKPRKDGGQAQQREGALALLALLQREGRLIDFLREPLDGFSDAEIGATARGIHRGCKKVIDQHFTFEVMIPGEEEEKVTVPKGFSPAEIRLIGEARGEPPFVGLLRHHGWRASEVRLPTLAEGVDRTVVAPAEVEVGAGA